MFHNILVPLDGSLAAESALKPAGELAQAFAGQIHLIRCLLSSPSADFASSAVNFHEACLHDEVEAREYLSEMEVQLRARGLNVQSQVLPGAAPEQIAKFAQQHRADLIVLTSHGRSGFSRLMLGSVAETLARIAPCPIMILRQPSSQDSSPNPTAQPI